MSSANGSSAAAAPHDPASDIGIADLPNQRHKIFTRHGASFTILVAGESGLGKTTFINTLFATTLRPPPRYTDRHRTYATEKTVGINVIKADLEEKGFSLRVNVVDTPGFGDYASNRGAWHTLVDYVDTQYESVMRQEQQPERAGMIIDQRVHACLYFIRPNGRGLKPLDVEAMRALATRCNLIPVVARADTLTRRDLVLFKEKVREQLDAERIDVYKVMVDDDEQGSNAAAAADPVLAEEEQMRAREWNDAMPFAVVGSERDVRTKDGRIVKGREYPWGVVEVENAEHCDFAKLRDLLIRSHMLDLITLTEQIHYDNYRAKYLSGQVGAKNSHLAARFKEEEDALRKRFTEQVKIEEARFRQWESRLMTERDRLNKDLEAEHSAVKQLEAEVEAYMMTMGGTMGKGYKR